MGKLIKKEYKNICMNKLFIVFTIAVFFISLNSVSAQEEITNAYYSYPILLSAGYDAHSPKIACNTYNDLCVALWYDKGFIGIGQGIHLAYSTNNFYTLVENYTASVNYDDYLNNDGKIYNNETGRWSNSSLPFDVEYNSDDNKFYFFYREYNSVTTHFYSWDLVNGAVLLRTLGATNQEKCTAYLSFVDEDYVGGISLSDSVAGTATIILYDYKSNTYQNILNYNWYGDTRTCSIVDASNLACNGVYKYKGDSYISTTGDVFYHFALEDFIVGSTKGYYGYSDFECASPANTSSVGNWTTGTFYYKDGMIYYRSRINETLGIYDGMYVTSSTDFENYGTPFLYYNYSDPSNPYIINRADFHRNAAKDIYQWENFTGAATSPTLPAIYSYNSTLTGVIVRTESMRADNISVAKQGVLVNISCDDSTFFVTGTTSSTGYFSTSVPCSNVTLTTLCGDCYPVSNSVSIELSEGEENFVNVLSFSNILNAYIKVIDQYTNQDISGVTVTVDGISDTTDGQGLSTFNLQPVVNPSMILDEISDTEFNIIYDTSTSSPREFDIQTTKIGYTTNSGSTSFMEFGTIGTYSFNVPKYYNFSRVFLTPIKTELIVNLFTNDLIEWIPKGATLTVTNGNNTKVFVNNILENRSYTNIFPAHFVFDNSTTVTLTLSIAGNSMVRTVDLIENEVITYDFISDYNSINTPCISFGDCPNIGCSGNIFYQVSSCTSNVCSYTSEQCLNCDNTVGCYDVGTTDACIYDHECQESCYDFKTVISGQCGSDGYCKGNLDVCDETCNETITEINGENITTAYCTENYNCLISTPEQKFEIYYTDINGVRTSDYANAVCNLANSGKNVCITGSTFVRGDNIPTINTLTDFAVTPSDWLVSDDSVTIQFSDISVYCSDSCDLTYKFCTNGCDSQTGLCKGTTPEIEDQISSRLPEWARFILNSNFIWMIIALVLGALFTYLPVIISNHGQPTPEIGLTAILVFYIAGIGFQFVDLILGLLIVLGISLGLISLISKKFSGSS